MLHPLTCRAIACAIALGGLAAGAAQAAEAAATPDLVPAPTAADKGFSYFIGLARQEARYRETGSILPFRSSVTSGSPLLVTGALYALDEQLLLSLDNETTFYPGRATETYSATAASFNGIALTSPVLQTNRFSLAQNKTQLLGQYRVRGPWFGVAGLALRSQSFKRFSFVQGRDAAVDLPAGNTVEETTSEVVLNLGAALETEQVRGSARHSSLRALVGLPLWRRLTNTDNPGRLFDSRRGHDLALEGRTSWALGPHMHLGAWGQYALTQRNAQVLGSASTRAEMPQSRLDSLSYGVELLWKL